MRLKLLGYWGCCRDAVMSHFEWNTLITKRLTKNRYRSRHKQKNALHRKSIQQWWMSQETLCFEVLPLKMPFTHTVPKTCLNSPAHSQSPVILNLMFYLLWNNEPLAGSLQRREHRHWLMSPLSTTQIVVSTQNRFTCSCTAGEKHIQDMTCFMPTGACLHRRKKKKEQKCDIRIITFSDNTNKRDGRSAKEHWKSDQK